MRKHAATKAISARAFVRLVISCARLPVLRPSQFTSVRTIRHATATGFSYPRSAGPRSPANSLNATAKYAIAADCIIQSQQPTRNPPYSPNARRE